MGEPWNFESSAGPNRLEGRIVSAEVGGEEAAQALTVEITPFTAKSGAVVTVLKAEARYQEDQETADPDDARFWRTAESVLREEIERRVPDPELREMLESLQRLGQEDR